MHMKKQMIWLLVLALVLSLCPAAMADEPKAKEIYTVEDLLAVREDPTGNYILMNDLDMTGVDWVPLDLCGGSFDGNGHAILNLTVNCTGETTDISYDGNRKTYDTAFAGFFGILRDASVCNLKLINMRANVTSDQPCFLGGIAGAMYDSIVTDCYVSGCLELRAHDRMFGVGGLAGYGSGRLERCQTDLTLICTDTGVDTLDEQFLGGAVATGFIDVVDCEITLDAYVSEYGYVHNGGLIGMVMQYPLGNGRTGYLTGNTVNGKITFFECNKDRRAYCDAYVGETLAASYSRKNNKADFKRDERKNYSAELRPEMCENPEYSEEVIAPGCDSFGYTVFTCTGCGYSCTDNYTLYQHTVTQWNITEEPDYENEGRSEGACDLCGIVLSKTEPPLEPTQPPTEPATEPETTATTAAQTEQPVVQEKPEKKSPVLLYGGATVLLAISVCFLPRKKGKFQK